MSEVEAIIGDKAAKAVFKFVQSDDYVMDMWLSNRDTGSAIDLTNYEIKLYITDDFESPQQEYTITATFPDAEAGHYRLTLPRTTTDDFTRPRRCSLARDGSFKLGNAEMKIKNTSTDVIGRMAYGPVYVILSDLEW